MSDIESRQSRALQAVSTLRERGSIGDLIHSMAHTALTIAYHAPIVRKTTSSEGGAVKAPLYNSHITGYNEHIRRGV